MDALALFSGEANYFTSPFPTKPLEVAHRSYSTEVLHHTCVEKKRSFPPKAVGSHT